MTTFSSLGLCRPVIAALESLNFQNPTPIQYQAIPHIIAGRDIVASAETGSGKTAAYALPILECLQESEGYPRALVIAPTRELAVQVQEQFEIFASHLKLKSLAVYGGTGFDSQSRALKKGVDILVATPGRLLDHMERKQVDISNVEKGVILNGTGPLAHLDGWTAAGKTGSAQKIDPATGRYSPTHFIASFTGFAPINNPAIAILVSLDSPVGLHEGGMVAAPVFKRIAEQVLPYLDVPRDVPVGPRLVQAAFKKSGTTDNAALEDFTPTDFSGLPEQPSAEAPASKQKESKSPTPAVTVAVDEGGDIQVPDFSGKTMRDVTEMCLRLGLDPVLVGSSLATNQMPAAGAKVRRGAKITVQFGTPAPKIAKPLQRARH